MRARERRRMQRFSRYERRLCSGCKEKTGREVVREHGRTIVRCSYCGAEEA